MTVDDLPWSWRHSHRNHFLVLSPALTSKGAKEAKNSAMLSSSLANIVCNVLIRPMNAKDAAAVAKIWRDGLSQTADSHGFVLKPIMRYSLEHYGNEAMKTAGDVGPEGVNLVERWMAKVDRTMLVACCVDSDDGSESKCIGCIGVKIGGDMEKEEPGSTVASVWRMSVEESTRRQGVGLKLLRAAEEWAREHQCKTMVLETTNKIAAQFYTVKAGYQEESFPKERSVFLHYLDIVKIYTKSLDVQQALSHGCRETKVS